VERRICQIGGRRGFPIRVSTRSLNSFPFETVELDQADCVVSEGPITVILDPEKVGQGCTLLILVQAFETEKAANLGHPVAVGGGGE
jgi:hypothetical protein